MKVGDSIRNGSLQDLFAFYDPRMLYSTPTYRTELLQRSVENVAITDFFGSMLDIHLQEDDEAYPLTGASIELSSNDNDGVCVNDGCKYEDISSTPSDVLLTSSPSYQQFQFSVENLLVTGAFLLCIMIVFTAKI